MARMGHDPIPPAVIDWLLDGDPAIRWQVQRDLLGATGRGVERERARVGREGWGRRLLDLQGEDGRWAADRGPARYRGLYIPKWTSTTYTLQLLAHLGLPAGDPGGLRGCRALVDGAEWFPSGGLGYFEARRVAEPCVSAMVLASLEAMDAPREARDRLAAYLVAAQLPDGGWNCDEGSQRGSLDTTTLMVEALAGRGEAGEALARGRELLLAHRLVCSRRDGRVIKPSYTRLRWQVGWETDVLRQLDHFARSRVRPDPRVADAVELLRRRRRPDGRWVATSPQPGALHFVPERAGAPSRMVTLRCLRVLRWWANR